MKLQDKVIVVTGGGNGLGRELVLNLLDRGARVAAVDISEAGLTETLELAGDRKADLSTHIVDITERAAVEALPEQVLKRHVTIDGLINNAGIIQPFVRLKDLDYEAIERVMNINFYGTLYMTKTFLPYLLERPEAHITNVSSMGGFLPVPGQTIYCASKAAMKLLTEGLHSELEDTHVGVTLILPGAMKTKIAEHSQVEAPSGSDENQKEYKGLAPDKAAKLILDGVESDRYRVLVGSDSKMMDFLYRLSPRRAAGFIFKQMRSLLPN
ncbi:MAG: SDR family NAD(P)-dependent oxidoreductase [Gammaproteobacteria bacterium]|nr:SDR family NAD(P)-dependent oxidoreductase [Gammaproteobacteria bacterium]